VTPGIAVLFVADGYRFLYSLRFQGESYALRLEVRYSADRKRNEIALHSLPATAKRASAAGVFL
jgi:hypothetical protein